MRTPRGTLMSKARNLTAALLAVTGTVALAQGVVSSGGGAPRFDPFHPELFLDSSLAASPATQPSYPTDPADTTGTVTPPPRPIIRDPLRPPTRSPFRP